MSRGAQAETPHRASSAGQKVARVAGGAALVASHERAFVRKTHVGRAENARRTCGKGAFVRARTPDVRRTNRPTCAHKGPFVRPGHMVGRGHLVGRAFLFI